MARRSRAFTAAAVYEERFSAAQQDLLYAYGETFVPPTMFNYTPTPAAFF